MVDYSGIASLSNVKGKVARMEDKEKELFFSLPVHVSEKIHGENFGAGMTEEGEKFIRQRQIKFIWNGTQYVSERDECTLYTRQKHMNEKVWGDINRIHEWLGTQNKVYQFFGEIFGDNVNQYFTYSIEGNEAIWFDIHDGEKYLSPDRINEIFEELNLTVPPFLGVMTMKEFLEDFDVNNRKSKIANEDFIEGAVAKPNGEQAPEWWDFADRLIIKKKIPLFAEVTKKDPNKKRKKKYESPFEQFVVEMRLEHVLEDLKQEGHEISGDKDFRMLVVDKMVANIQKEENEDKDFEPRDKKALTIASHKVFSIYLSKW
jgi:hypothetical protein